MNGDEKYVVIGKALSEHVSGSSMAFQLMDSVLQLIFQSGANQQEAQSALRAAEAMLPALDLRAKASLTVET
jgi:hypothetical protein